MFKIRAYFGHSNIDLEVTLTEKKSIIEGFQNGISPIIVSNNKIHVDVSKAVAVEELNKEESL